MDWFAVAARLAERIKQPTVVVDAQGLIQLANSGMERTLGLGPSGAEGKPWDSVFRADTETADARDWLRRALNGALIRRKVAVRVSEATRLQFDFELSPVGAGSERGILLVAISCFPVEDPRIRARDSRTLEYEIDASIQCFGKLTGVVTNGEFAPIAGDFQCYRTLHGTDRPCTDCPALRPISEPWPRSVIRVRQGREPAEQTFELVDADRVSDTAVRLRVLTISNQTLHAVHKSKVEALSRRADLSERETQVLECLITGQSIDEIAQILKISRRTIKYHQANVLEKLGADSRLDLMRLLF